VKKSVIVAVMLATLLVSLVPGVAGAATYRVTESQSIQEAIDAASDGDVIFVGPGTYTESVIVNKAVSIKGAGADVTTVQSPDGTTAFAVVASNVSIRGFTIKGATDINNAGILIGGRFPGDASWGVTNVKVSKNIIENNAFGIYIWKSSANSIVNNVVRYNCSVPAHIYQGGTGIIVWDQPDGQDVNNLIKNNEVYYNYKFGIFVGADADMNADGTKINGNKLYRNGAYWDIGAGDRNWLGMGFMNAMGTISVHGNNVFPTSSGLDYWVWNCPGVVLDGTPSYGGIPVPPAP
jgi:parallel beta-helix repeat protein